MAGDRDLAVAFATARFADGGPTRSGWETTAATGVRGLRVLRESGAFNRFLLTEANPEAGAVLAENCRRFSGASAECADGRRVPDSAPFDYVDIDPYGSPVPFVGVGLSSVRPGGVLAVTATDMVVLAGVQRGVCERRYGGRPIRGRLGPEAGLRVLLAFLAREARVRDRTIRPLLSYVRDHHVRSFLEVRTARESDARDPVETIEPASWSGPPVDGAGPYGPLWTGPLYDPGLVGRIRTPE
jgi:tRNA (guanine26-N2/guanine27-N2)-dimethyltransferase